MPCCPSFAFIFLYIPFFWPRLPSLSLPCRSPFSSVCNCCLPVSKERVIEGKRVPFLGDGDIMGKLEILLLSVEVVWSAMSLSRLSPFRDDILEILFCFNKEELVNTLKRTLWNHHISDTLRPHSYHGKDLGGAKALVIICFRCETQSYWHDIFWVMFLSNYKMIVIINALPTWQGGCGYEMREFMCKYFEQSKAQYTFYHCFLFFSRFLLSYFFCQIL